MRFYVRFTHRVPGFGRAAHGIQYPSKDCWVAPGGWEIRGARFPVLRAFTRLAPARYGAKRRVCNIQGRRWQRMQIMNVLAVGLYCQPTN